jgi:3-deoxy-D-manno-octulosonic-acid transferase
MYFWYNLVLRLGSVLLSPVWVPAALFARQVRTGLGTRLGFPPRVLREALGDLPRPRVWFHAASVGELSAIAPVAAAFQERMPNAVLMVSTMTLNGLALAAERVPSAARTFLVPLDLRGAVRRMLRWVEPDLLVIGETELWPNLVREAKRRGCQLALVNGRLSERSHDRYRRVRGLMRQVLGRFDLLAVQTERDAERFLSLGANPQRVKVTGNVKADQDGPGADLDALRAELRLTPELPVWVAGSTRPGEEALVLEAFAQVRTQVPEAVLILAPRHLERLREVERLLAEHKLAFSRRSRVPGELLAFPVILLDTLGELARIYGLGRVAFVGGSLVPQGGHNPLEPAVLGVPVLFGPHTEHFAQTAEVLQRKGGARTVADAGELARAVTALLQDPEEARRRGELARRAVSSQRGAAAATAELLQKLMLIKRWSSEVKGWRAEAAAGAQRSGGKDISLEDWPEWPL